uniref:Ovule protein n=1 Tax=Globodera pallida TaxID=36090 RepID=A0A183C012_GLOPA
MAAQEEEEQTKFEELKHLREKIKQFEWELKDMKEQNALQQEKVVKLELYQKEQKLNIVHLQKYSTKEMGASPIEGTIDARGQSGTPFEKASPPFFRPPEVQTAKVVSTELGSSVDVHDEAAI